MDDKEYLKDQMKHGTTYYVRLGAAKEYIKILEQELDLADSKLEQLQNSLATALGDWQE